MRALGANISVEMDVFDVERDVSAVLLCSDGLTNMLNEEQIEKVLDSDIDMFDDIVIYETYDELPQPGDAGVIYRVNGPEDKAGSYYWNGSNYVPTYTSITPEEIDEVTGTIDSDQIDSMFI